MSMLTNLRVRLTLNNTLIAVVTLSFINGVEQSMIGVVFPPFAMSLGAGMSQLGFRNSLGGFSGLRLQRSTARRVRACG